MKKFASILLAVLVVFSMFSFVVSADGVTLTAAASKTDVKVGEEVTVTVALSEKSGLSAITAKVTFDANVFEPVKGSATSTLGAVVNEAFGTGAAIATLAVTTTVEEAGTLISFKLKAVKAGESAIKVVVDEAVDTEYKEVAITTNSVNVKVAAAPADTECKHDYSNVTEIKAATCKDAGVAQKSCKVCGDTVEEAIPATGKCVADGKWVTVKAATANAAGEKVQKCKFCGEVAQKAVIPALGSTTAPSIPNTDAQA